LAMSGRSIGLLVVLALATLVDAQKGSPFRCRDRDPKCEEWAGRGECSSNHDFMAESCPNACEYCENGGLMPTPSPFQLDLVCKDQLAINSGAYKGGAADDLPSNCEFRCRDNMTESICAKATAEGKCQDKAVAKAVRKQCPASCGVCKALGMATATPYPKGACREAEGNSAEHEASCAAWAEAGECFNNFGFMSISCEAACGLCEVGGATPETPAKINSPPRPPRKTKSKGGKKKKKVKKVSVDASGETTADGEAAAEAVPEASSEEEPEVEVTQGEPAAEDAPKKKKNWMGRAAEAVGSAFKKGGKAAPKDET